MKPHRLLLIFVFVSTFGFAADGSFQRTLQVSGPVDLEVRTGSGHITVHTGGGNTVQINGTIRAHGHDADERVHQLETNPPIEQNGNSIRVGHDNDPELFRSISIDYDITVPAATSLHSHTGSGHQRIEGIRGPAEVHSGSGNLEISNIGGEVRADAGSGNVTLENIKGSVNARAGSGDIRASSIAGPFDGRTGSGSVRLQQTAAGDVRVDTGSGGVELSGVKGALVARAGSGDIRAEGEPTSGWRLHTGSGGVTVRLPSAAAFDLYARTSSGSISVDQPVTVQGTVGRHELRGKVRGGGTLVELETGSGNIRVE